MHDSIFEKFFAIQHKKMNKRAYTFIHFTCKNSPIPSDYGEIMRRKTRAVPETSNPESSHKKS